MRKLITCLLLFAASTTAYAQPLNQTARRVQSANALPPTCFSSTNVKDLIWQNGVGLSVCTAANTYTAVGGATPGGSGTELQYRAGASTLGAVTGSSVSGANVTLGGTLTLPASAGRVLFGASADFLDYIAATGPRWYDNTQGFALAHNIQALTANRTVTWPNTTGTVTILGNSNLATSITGNAATATALAANPTNCSAGNYPLGIDASGNVENCTAAATAGVTGTGTVNTIPKITNAAGPVISDSSFTNPSSGAIATGAGTAFVATATAPAAAASSQAGTAFTISASNAVAGTANNGAANGGDLTLNAGDSARLNTGSADGGSVIVNPGLQTAAGTAGALWVKFGRLLRLDNSAVTTPYGFCMNCVVNGSVVGDSGRVSLIASGSEKAAITGHGFGISTTSCLQSGTDLLDNNRDTNQCRDAAGVWRIEGGGAGGAAKGGVKTIADSNGSYSLAHSNTELLILSTSGTTTATSGNLCPVGSRIKAIVYRITTTITGTASFQIAPSGLSNYVNIGTATTLQSTLTAGTTGILVASTYGDQFENTAATVTVTTTATAATAGVIRLTVLYEQYSPPSS